MEKKTIFRSAVSIALCAVLIGCFSYPAPQPPPDPVDVVGIRAFAKDMSEAILALPEVAEAAGTLHIRFDGVGNDTLEFDDVFNADIFGRMLVGNLSTNAAGRVVFFEKEADSRDVDYALRGNVVGKESAGLAGRKIFTLVTMELVDPVSGEVRLSRSRGFEVFGRNGVAYQ